MTIQGVSRLLEQRIRDGKAVGAHARLAAEADRAFFENLWVDRLAQVGVVRSDSDEERGRKATVTLTSALITVLSVIWVGTYAALGLWLSALIPFAYQLASVASIAAFARTKRYRFFRASQLGMMLVLPFLLQWSLGGFGQSSAVALWALMAPLGALVSSICAGLSPGSWPSSRSSPFRG